MKKRHTLLFIATTRYKQAFFFVFCISLLLLPQRAVSQNQTDYYIQAKVLYLLAKNDSALACLDKALNEPTNNSDYEKMVHTLLLRSQVACNLTLFESAMEDAIRAHTISKDLQKDNLLAASLVGIGKVHYYMYNDSVAEKYLQQALALTSINKHKKERMITVNALAQLYCVSNQNEKALPLIDQSYQLAEELRDTSYIIQNLGLYASYYTNLNRWDTERVKPEYQQKTKQYLDEALQLALKKNYVMHIQNIYLRFLRYYRVEKKYEEALKYAEKIIDIAEPTNYSLLIQVYDHLVTIYAKMGNPDLSVKSHQQFYSLMQKQSDYNLHQSLQDMRVKHDTQEKELQIAQQQIKLNQQKTRFRYSILATSTAAIIIFLLLYIMFTRRKHNQILYNKNRDLIRSNATKDKLLSIISHDLKSPLLAQQIAIETMRNEIEKCDKESILSNLNEFQDSTETQLNLLQNLLNWAKMQLDDTHYKPIFFDISDTIRDTLSVYKLSAKQKNISLQTHFEGSTMAFADRSMIQTVLLNLLNNAVKFSFSNTNAQITIGTTEKTDRITVSVADNGVGMNAKQIDNLLNTGITHSTTGTGGEKGNGLGLVICKEFLQMNSSKLQIKSSNKGTTISFDLIK